MYSVKWAICWVNNSTITCTTNINYSSSATFTKTIKNIPIAITGTFWKSCSTTNSTFINDSCSATFASTINIRCTVTITIIIFFGIKTFAWVSSIWVIVTCCFVHTSFNYYCTIIVMKIK